MNQCLLNDIEKLNRFCETHSIRRPINSRGYSTDEIRLNPTYVSHVKHWSACTPKSLQMYFIKRYTIVLLNKIWFTMSHDNLLVWCKKDKICVDGNKVSIYLISMFQFSVRHVIDRKLSPTTTNLEIIWDHTESISLFNSHTTIKLN